MSAALVVALGACGERARLVFDPETDGVGPDTSIDNPETADAHLPAGPQFNLAGRAVDRDGVDTVYFVLTGADEQFAPYVANEFQDTVRFSLPITTSGNAGNIVTVQIFATDLLGARGDTATRRLIIE